MFRVYLQNDAHNEVLMLFCDMMRENVKPTCYTFPMVLKSCCKLLALREGEEMHCLSTKYGFMMNTYVSISLIELYSGVGCVQYAYRVFTEMADRNVVSWTAMILGYVENGDLSSARRLFNLAPERDVVLWNRMITVYINCGDMVEAQRLFDRLPSKDLMSWNTLLNGYSKNGDIDGCERLFEEMHERNIFSWNGMIRGYARNGSFHEVLGAFKRMLEEKAVQPNDATLVHVLSSCARLGALDFGKWVHVYVENNRYGENVYVNNGLIEMYAKCGLVGSAVDVFRSMDKRDLVSWNTIINCLAVHGHGAEALNLFNEMKNDGEKPDGITFIGILCACSHMGLVKDGINHFQSMINIYSIVPQIEHYGCVVDLLARAGLLEQAVKFAQNMPLKPDNVIWSSLLAASRLHKNIEFAKLSLQKLTELDSENPANYVMLSNIYGEAKQWQDLARAKAAMRETGCKKIPGCSLIEIEGEIVEFYSFDERHFRTADIYSALRMLTEMLGFSEFDPGFMEL